MSQKEADPSQTPDKEFFVHPTADVSPESTIGSGTKIWNWAQVRENANIGEDCIISKGVYIDEGVKIGAKVKIQNNASVYKGVEIEDGVFVGPHVCFTNDLRPRAVNTKFEPTSQDDWDIVPTTVERGASIGANSTVVPGVTIGEFAMIGAGSVVTKDVEPYTLVRGNPVKVVAKIDEAGEIIERYT